MAVHNDIIHRIVKWGLMLAFLLYAAKYIQATFANFLQNDIWANDFFGIWSFAKFSVAHSAPQIYNNSTLRNFQMDLGGSPRDYLPYAYPPSFLLFIIPLGSMSYYIAFGLWTLGTFVLYFIASTYKQLSRDLVFLVLFAPATIFTFAAGQTGFLSSALIIGGFRLIGKRPMLAGILFGLASIKPQLGILVPVALISARQWRSAAAAGATVVALVVASSLAFGWSIWPLWLLKLVSHASWAANANSRLSTTIAGNLTLLGVDLSAARTVQACAAALVTIIIWICFRRGVTVLATAALLVGTFLATPYAFVYDTPMVTNAALALVIRRSGAERSTIPEILIVAMSLVLPAVITETWKLSMMRSLPLSFLFGLIVWHIVGSRGGIGASMPNAA
jgi:Glycosyltransferase family 87